MLCFRAPGSSSISEDSVEKGMTEKQHQLTLDLKWVVWGHFFIKHHPVGIFMF
jgi:hypothetical protein